LLTLMVFHWPCTRLLLAVISSPLSRLPVPRISAYCVGGNLKDLVLMHFILAGSPGSTGQNYLEGVHQQSSSNVTASRDRLELPLQ